MRKICMVKNQWNRKARKGNGHGVLLVGISVLVLLAGIYINSGWIVQKMAQAKRLLSAGETSDKLLPSQAWKVQQSSAVDYYKKLYKKKKASSVVTVKGADRKQIRALFYQSKISDEVFQRMYKKSYKKNCTVPKKELRYVRVLYYGFDKKTHIGELVVNRRIARDICTIFYKLYCKKYPIEKMVLVDEYNAVDEASMADNNTSAFNYRPVSGTTHLSKHSYGMAIDINPLYNPYIHTINGKRVCEPANGKKYVNRSKEFPYKIDEKDLCYKLFVKYGFTWGGSWKSVKDYQHFERKES